VDESQKSINTVQPKNLEIVEGEKPSKKICVYMKNCLFIVLECTFFAVLVKIEEINRKTNFAQYMKPEENLSKYLQPDFLLA
jgi:hypothetical protein